MTSLSHKSIENGKHSLQEQKFNKIISMIIVTIIIVQLKTETTAFLLK